MATFKRAALYVRVSTADRGQMIKSSYSPFHESAERLGWTVVAIHKDEGSVALRAATARPGLDGLLRAGLPPMRTAAGRAASRGSVVGAVASDRLTPDEGPALAAVLVRQPHAMDSVEPERCISALEARQLERPLS